VTDPAYVAPVDLARAPAAGGGELVLRTRPGAGRGGTDVYELIVDGIFAMDTVEVSTELRLASETLRRLPGRDWRIVVGGLGLGFTLRELLSDQRVARVDVVELEPALVQWVRDGFVRPAMGVLDDLRAHVTTGDIAAYLDALEPGSVDAILLDVDNGPDFLVHQSNSPLYQSATLATALGALRRGGLLTVWSAGPAPALRAALDAISTSVEEVPLAVRREGRTLDYALYLATGP
jgi:spermidine synthase